ncbi:MAG TPA: GGDEF domain-containing protein [Acidobacteriaceae bacterium]|jgi:diguanylate cyclase (GGDEF)-like protein
MPRSPLPRTLLALLPILGALLAAFAAHKDLPIPLSLLTMTVIASASAVIYWSAPLSKRKPAEPPPKMSEQNPLSAVLPDVMPELAAVAEPPEEPAQVSQTTSTSLPEPGSIGTRADTLVTGEPREADLLTGLLGWEAFLARLTGELNRCRDANQTAVLVVCDLDAFGEINRRAGLVEANRMLRQVADCFRLTVREGDILSRLGGDEFGIFFPGLPPEVTEARARDLRAAVREAGLLILPDSSPQVTACIGTSCFPGDGNTVEALLAAAQLSLANAKRERQEKANHPIPSALVLTRN